MSDESKDDPIVIKKYANRRLYNTRTSSYVTLENLCEMVKEGMEFEVRDARTDEDITRSVLTQIIFEQEAKGQNLLPIKFLRQLITMYGNSLQGFVPGYLDLSMESFIRNQEAFRKGIAEALGGGGQALEKMTRQNLAIFERTMRMFSPFGAPAARQGEHEQRSAGNGPEQRPRQTEDIDAMRNEIEAMRKKLDDLARERK